MKVFVSGLVAILMLLGVSGCQSGQPNNYKKQANQKQLKKEDKVVEAYLNVPHVYKGKRYKKGTKVKIHSSTYGTVISTNLGSINKKYLTIFYKSDFATLNITSNPKNARIRILNIQPKYKDGIELKKAFL